MTTKQDYQAVANKLNKMLGLGNVSVELNPHNEIAEKYSLVLDDDAYEMLWTYNNGAILDNNFAVGAKDFYIEPYNRFYMNIYE